MLNINNLSITLQGHAIIKDLHLHVATGEALAIIGESGAGKTTLVKSIMGLVKGEIAGEISFHGSNLVELSPTEMNKLRWQQIAMVFQNVEGALNPAYTVMQQVTEPIRVHGLIDKRVAKEKARVLFNKVGISEKHYDLYPHQLSGGQKQRVLLAMALANNPPLLILDEPTAGLDPLTKTEIIELLLDLRGKHTLILITHDFDTAAKLTHKTAVLYGGNILEYGATAALLNEPRHPYTRGLLRAYPNMTTVKDLQGIPGQLSRPKHGCVFAPRCTQRQNQCLSERPVLTEALGRSIACHQGGVIRLLEVDHLNMHFGRKRILNNISCALTAGETLAIVGESGSGKTTLARCIMGLHENYEGTIFVEHHDVRNRKGCFYQKVQMVFQNPWDALSHRLTVLELIREPLDIHGVGTSAERVEKVKQVLVDVELPQDDRFLATYAHHLSGGEAQRVAIARALILEPKLLIADEPTSALDPSVQAKIMRLLLTLQEQKGLSMLFITHDIALARKVSDRILVLKEGQVVELQRTDRLVSNPEHTYTKALLAAAPDLLLA